MKNFIYSERANLFEPNIYIQFLVNITGNPPADILMSAVKAAFTANEATMSKIVLERDGTAYYKKISSHRCSVTFAEKDWITLIRENEKIPFHIDKGELMRVFINTSNNETSLLIIAHHLVGDGKSITYFLEDVMNALSGKKLEYKPLHLITKSSFPPKSSLSFFFKAYANSLSRKWNQIGDNFTWDDYYNIHNIYWEKRSSNIIYETFSSEEVTKIQAYAKKMGISVNSYISTAFLKANFSNHCIGIAVDARIDSNPSMSNQATGISVDYAYSEKISFNENARILHRKVYKKLNNPMMKYFILQFIPLFPPTLIDSILLHTYNLYKNKTTHKLAKVMGYQGEKTRELGITNLTKLDIPNTYGRYELKGALFIPPVVSYAKHIIGVATMNDGMRISYHFMNEKNESEEQEFFKHAIQTIRALCNI